MKATIQLKKLPPMEVISRNLLIADLATIPVDMVAKIAPEICIEMEHQVKNEDGEIVTISNHVINWGVVLFNMNTYRLEALLSHFQMKNKIYTEKEKENMQENAKNIIHSLAGSPKPKEN